jgi:hypothetical protein
MQRFVIGEGKDAIAECHCSIELIIKQWHLRCSLFMDHLTFTLKGYDRTRTACRDAGRTFATRIPDRSVTYGCEGHTGGPGRARSSPTFSVTSIRAAQRPTGHSTARIACFNSSYLYIASKAISDGRIVLGNLLS